MAKEARYSLPEGGLGPLVGAHGVDQASAPLAAALDVHLVALGGVQKGLTSTAYYIRAISLLKFIFKR